MELRSDSNSEASCLRGSLFGLSRSPFPGIWLLEFRPRACFEFLLDSCDPFEKVISEGLTFGKLALLAYQNGAEVELFRGNQCTIDDFRKYVVKCATSTDVYMVTYYDRAHLNQMRHAHFAPIGAYHGGRDLVLVIDVARFEYPPFWIPLELLWKALTSTDEATGYQMGFMLLSRLLDDPCLIYSLSCRDESWISTAEYLRQLPVVMKTEDIKDIEHVLAVVFGSPSSNYGKFITRISKSNTDDGRSELPEVLRKKLVEVEAERLANQEELLRQVQETQLYKHVGRWLDSKRSSSQYVASLGDSCTLPDIPVDWRGIHHLTSRPSSSPLDSNGRVNGSDRMLTVKLSGPGVAYTSPDVISLNDGLLAADALTMMLFTLPPQTWSGISNAKLSAEVKSLVSIDNIPPLLKKEVLSLRKQLQLLMMDLGSYST